MSPIGDQDRDGAERPLAAEYALGVLDGPERARAEALAARDPAFAAEVAAWQARLAPLADDVAPVSPPESLWARIEARLPVALPERKPSPARPGLWRNLAFWRGLSFGSLGLAAASVAALVIVARTPAPVPLLARLGPAAGGATFVAAVDPQRRAVMVIPAALGGADARVPELWLIPADGVPRSLGVFDPDHPAAMPIPEALMPHMTRSAALAVTLEPPGGAPGGRPTGPVIAQGTLATF
jgi:anti-sigma-K factor RskA